MSRMSREKQSKIARRDDENPELESVKSDVQDLTSDIQDLEEAVSRLSEELLLRKAEHLRTRSNIGIGMQILPVET